VLDWPDLQVLHAIAAAGSLAGAGRILGVRHTTVGRRLDELERLAGAKLVDRLPGGALLTPLGDELAAVAADVETLMASAGRKLRGDPGEITGTVSVTAPPLLATDVIAPGLAPLLARHPTLVVDLEASASVASLIRNEADIALRLGDPSEPSLLSQRIATVRLALYATPDIARQPPTEWRFIGYGPSLAHLPHQRWLEEQVGTRAVALRTNDVHAQLAAVASGLGVAMLPCALADRDPRLVRIAGDGPPARPLWLLVHPDIRRSAAVTVVIDHLVALFAQDGRFAR
jgi:DNA-binding transcriptional LysR family regulator